MIAIYNTKEEYSPEEARLLVEAFEAIESKHQGEQLSIDDTRIIVAYRRYQQEKDFKIVAVKQPKQPKEPKPPKPPKEKKKTKKQLKEEQVLDEQKTKRADLLFKRHVGVTLTEEQLQFLEDTKELT